MSYDISRHSACSTAGPPPSRWQLTPLFGICAAEVVVDRGQNVTLRCSYKVSSSGPLSSSKPLIFSDGHRVTERVSERYLLLGRLDQGDVSLTILSVSVEDAGTYGCKVDKPGLNNDQKHHHQTGVHEHIHILGERELNALYYCLMNETMNSIPVLFTFVQ
uniref:Ig-like domain-containing protein n=1 Tax=Neogobius melanostomus TaxID=47308 RepID=A0A8C6UDA6_9GOBI